MMTFSPQLIGEYRAYYLDRFGKDITVEIADKHLRVLAGLFLAYTPEKMQEAQHGSQYLPEYCEP